MAAGAAGTPPEGSEEGGEAPRARSDIEEALALETLLSDFIREQEKKTIEPGVTDEREADTYLGAWKAGEEQRHRQREKLTPALMNIAQGWVIALILIMVWQGFGSKIGFFGLSDPVLIAFLTTSTANILGLFYIAVRYLYATPDFKSPRMRHPEEKRSRAP